MCGSPPVPPKRRKMNKREFMRVTVRPVNKEDAKFADSEYKRNAKFITTYKGHEWFSADGSLRDMEIMVEAINFERQAVAK